MFLKLFFSPFSKAVLVVSSGKNWLRNFGKLRILSGPENQSFRASEFSRTPGLVKFI